MAEYFAESIPVGGRLRTGQVPPNRLHRMKQRLENKEHIPLEELLGLSNEQWRARLQSENGPVQYDQAWSIVHFLVNGDQRYRRAFLQYLGAVAQGASHRQAYQKAFGGGSYDAFERAWRQYMLELEPTPAKIAAERLRFLAHGIKMLHEDGKTIESVEQLKEALRRIRFRVRQRIGHGFEIERSAEDDELFTAPDPDNARRSAELTLEPAEQGSNLPPGAVVRGLELTVRLKWVQGAEGEEPISRIEYE
jgi:hypothetical protein